VIIVRYMRGEQTVASFELRLLLANIIVVIANVIMMIAASLEMNDALAAGDGPFPPWSILFAVDLPLSGIHAEGDPHDASRLRRRFRGYPCRA